MEAGLLNPASTSFTFLKCTGINPKTLNCCNELQAAILNEGTLGLVLGGPTAQFYAHVFRLANPLECGQHPPYPA